MNLWCLGLPECVNKEQAVVSRANVIFDFNITFIISCQKKIVNIFNKKRWKRMFPSLTGAEGLEPSTFGFGDQRSTN